MCLSWGGGAALGMGSMEMNEFIFLVNFFYLVNLDGNYSDD